MAEPQRLKLIPWPLAEVRGAHHAPARALSVLLAVLLVAALARLALPIPGTPVPITLQDLGVLAVGIALGPRRGAAALALYLGLGALGAPVFSNGNAGVVWLLGPTGGYLMAFPLAAFVAGLATRRPISVPKAAAGILAAQASIFAGGLLHLRLLTGGGLEELFLVAVAPFLPGALVKTGLLISLCAAWASRRRARP